MDVPSYVRREELDEREGILVRAGEGESPYRSRWEQEAHENHVSSAIGRGAGGDGEYGTITAKVAPLWRRVPSAAELGDVLEIGSGYGRIPLFLANDRKLSWRSYCAVDISETMLRRLLEYRGRFAPGRPLTPICLSAERLPFEDDSFDLVLSSAVFLHMGKTHVRATLRELARVLRPGAGAVFDVSFPNGRNPASAPARLKPRRLRSPHYLKFWTRAEVERTLHDSGLGGKAGPMTVEPGAFALLPKAIGPVPVPLARRVNAALGTPPARLRDLLGVTFDAYTTKLAA